jgi:hypothetical protein
MRVVSHCCAVIVAALSMLSCAHAQERAPNPGKQTIIRTWPGTGAWQVALLRLVDGPLGCILATGRADAKTGESYSWGIRWRRENVAASISDNNPQAVAGPTIQIFVDKVAIGTYQVSKRTSSGPFSAIAAELPAAESDRLLSLIGVGGEMQYVINNFTYSAPLQGAQQGLVELKACTVEATHLDHPQSQ